MSFTHYVNGTFALDAKIDATDLGLMRGYGVFDYARLFRGKPFHLIDHLKRLLWSAEQVHLRPLQTLEDLYELTLSLIEKNPPIDAGIRFIITGGEAKENHLLPTTSTSLAMLFQPHVPPLKRYYEEGMRVCRADMLRILPAIKTTNYMPAIFGLKKARDSGFDDALYINDKGEILEGTTSNVFFFKNDTLITPDIDIVKGVTRAIFLELAEEEFSIEYRPIHIDEIKDCTEAFLTSSIKGGAPLVQIENQLIGDGLPGPRTSCLCKQYNNYTSSYINNNTLKLTNS